MFHIYIRTVLTVLFITCILFLNAQVISKFTWDTNPVTTAIIGPNAISAGSSATSSPGGVAGTNGLNPGSPTADINMHIPNTGNVFDIPNIDISIDYRRNESVAQMIKRNNFTFNAGGIGSFQVKYKIGSTGVSVTTTAITIPSDNTFRNYRFTYDNCTGVATLYINNSAMWSTPTPTANQNLYWVGEGDIVIGQDMDGTGNNIPNLDNFILQPYTCSTLPIELTGFTGKHEGNKNLLEWTTATEKNNDFFTLEKSANGFEWTAIATVYGAGNSHMANHYSVYDDEPANTLNYYRLTQTDYDLQKTFSPIIQMDNTTTNTITILKVIDLLGRETNATDESPRLIYFSDGSVIKKIGN